MKINTHGLGSALALTIVLCSLTHPTSALAASGGRISGGSFRSSSPSYSRPSSLSGGGFSRSYTSPSITSRPSRSSSWDDDFDSYIPPVIIRDRSPVIIPVPSLPSAPDYVPAPSATSATAAAPVVNPEFDGKIFLSFLLAASVAGLAIWWLTRGSLVSLPRNNSYVAKGPDKTTLTKVQVAMLASARDMRNVLIRLAENGDASTSDGLAQILEESSLAIMRNPELIVYANCENHVKGLPAIEQLFNRETMVERSRMDEEVVFNIAGKHTKEHWDESPDNEYIVVTILVASMGTLEVPGCKTADDLRKSLVAVGSLEPDDILGLEILWQPEGKGEVLTRDELLNLYPNLMSI